MGILNGDAEDRLHWWSHESPTITMIAGWYAVGDAREGEDGPPCVRVREDGNEGFIAVFDGLGGAGVRPMWQLADDEKPLTSACVAAYISSLAALNWHASGQRSGVELKEQILGALRQADAASNVPKPRYSGSALRQLPTTLAAIDYRYVEGGETLLVRPLWVGDSRCFVLDAERGLQQISRDDVRGEPDALDALRSSPPMSATIGIDRPFEIHEISHYIHPPLVIAVMTDGCTDYVATPHQLELRLLGDLASAETPVEWAKILTRTVARAAADDASLVVLAYGFGGFAQLQAAFAARLEHLTRLEATTIGRSDPADAESQLAAAKDAWERYRSDYEQILRSEGIA